MDELMYDWARLFDAVHNDLIISNGQGVVVYANKVSEQLYLMPREEIIGKGVLSLHHEKSAAGADEADADTGDPIRRQGAGDSQPDL